MSSRGRFVAFCAALSLILGAVTLLAVDGQAPAELGASAAGEPPPAPVLSAQGRSVIAQLESWCWPVDDHFSCTAATPAVGHQFVALSVRRRANVTLDTRRVTERVRIQLSPQSGAGKGRTFRPERLGSRRWRFRMSGRPARARIRIAYRDDGIATAIVFLRPR